MRIWSHLMKKSSMNNFIIAQSGRKLTPRTMNFVLTARNLECVTLSKLCVREPLEICRRFWYTSFAI